ncbi:GNAT family N-acetyltransferase [Orrella sp. JC864]|uniref:GNAT family N-acetyltransferase n=1 Tax=Orrella sp. JC864 TaxID=3120298 RepID=UPI0012BC69EC
MRQPATVNVILGAWEGKLREDASAVRVQVFVREQAVPPALEMDDMDAVSVHAVAYGQDGQALGTGRLLPDGHIGRMAVHAHARGLGVGSAILQALVERARALGYRRLALNAQLQALDFYARHGFVAQGPQFMEAGIAHREMALALDPD